MHIGPKEFARYFFRAFFSFFSKIEDGRQNPMSLSRAWTASSICFMIGLAERPYPAHVLISFWCESDNKNLDFYYVSEFQRIFQFCSFWLSSIFGNIAIHPCSNYFKIFAVCILALGNFPGKFCWRFSAFSTKFNMAAKILCHSLELELLHKFVSCLVQRNNPTLDVCWLVFCVIMIIKTYIFFTF